MNHDARESVIRDYIAAYNSFDLEKMVKDFHSDIVFKNIGGGETNLEFKGIQQFREQAKQAAGIFSEREQLIKNISFENSVADVEIEYTATLAIDLPNGLKKGQQLQLKGRSVFEFEKNKIISLTDIS